jgi:hypothetical protein
MNEFLKELDKFYQTYKPKTEFELRFQKQKYKIQFLKFIQKFLEFKPNSKLNCFRFELIQRNKKKNLTIHSGLAAAHSHRTHWAKPSFLGPRQAFGWSRPAGTASAHTARGHHVWSRLERRCGELAAD